MIMRYKKQRGCENQRVGISFFSNDAISQRSEYVGVLSFIVDCLLRDIIHNSE